ncbi:MAG: hypothetical protein ACRBF0_24310 [Calditrichia bacterium]
MRITVIGKSGLLLLQILFMLSFAQAQDEGRSLGLSIGSAVWMNRCDIPAAQQSSQLEPSFGPFVSLSYGKFIFGMTFFHGRFQFDPQDGITRLDDGRFAFSDATSRERRFTTDGWTRRTDVDVNIRYVFNRYAQLSFGLTLNRRQASVDVLRGPRQLDDGGIILPNDEQNVSRLKYTSNQLWINEGIHGSFGIETISSRFSMFYSGSVLLIVGEEGTASVETYLGQDREFNTSRVAYKWVRDEASGQGGIIFEPLESRGIGTNAGMTFSSGLGFEVYDRPSLVLFVGYNLKFFAEKETELLDNSIFHGPYMGLSWNVF